MLRYFKLNQTPIYFAPRRRLSFPHLSCAVTSLQQTDQLRFSPFTGKLLTYPLFPVSLSHTFSSAKRNFIFLFSAKPLNSNLLDLALFL